MFRAAYSVPGSAYVAAARVDVQVEKFRLTEQHQVYKNITFERGGRERLIKATFYLGRSRCIVISLSITLFGHVDAL